MDEKENEAFFAEQMGRDLTGRAPDEARQEDDVRPDGAYPPGEAE